MIKIVGATSSAIAPETAQELDITLVPLYVTFGSETLRDEVDISKEVFLERLITSHHIPTTAQPSAGDFLDVFKKLRAAGDDVLCVLLSNKLSGTILSANAAKEQLRDDRITIFDTFNVAAAEAMQVIEAARLTKAGRRVPEIVERLEKMRDGMRLYFVLDTLEYLAKGGRIGNAQALIGSLLQMKPILEIKNGEVEAAERIRTKPKAHARLRQIVDEAVHGKSNVQMGVMYTGDKHAAQALADDLRRSYGLKECTIYPVSPVVAAHAGPGALGVAFCVES